MERVPDHPAIHNAERWGYPHRPSGEDMYDDGVHYIEDDYAIGYKSYEDDVDTDPFDEEQALYEELTDELPILDPFLQRLRWFEEMEGDDY